MELLTVNHWQSSYNFTYSSYTGTTYTGISRNLFQNLYYLDFVIQQLLPAPLPNFKSFENLGHIDLLIQSIYTEHVALLSDFLSFIICRRQQLQVVEWGSITDLHLLRTLLAIRQKLQPSHFWELIDSFVLLAYVSLAASKNLFKRLLACLHITLDSEYLLKMVNSQLVSINCSNSRKNNCHWKYVLVDYYGFSEVFIIFFLISAKVIGSI